MKKFFKLQYLFLLALPIVAKVVELSSSGYEWWKI